MNQLVFTAATENANYFLKRNSESSRLLYNGFQHLASQCREVTPLLENITRNAPRYDFDAETPGNGFRSFIIIFEAMFRRCSSLCDIIKRERSLVLFKLSQKTYIQDLKTWNELFAALKKILEHLNTLIEWNDKDEVNSLFPSSSHPSQELLEQAKTIESYSFYGRHAAFYFCPSIQNILNGLLTIMAGYSDYYFSKSSELLRVAKGVFKSTQYTLDAEQRARKIVEAFQNANVDFCKSFWFLAESDLMKKIPDGVFPTVKLNQLILIPPEPFQINSIYGEPVDIPSPSAHGPSNPVQVRLLSAKGRPGMPGKSYYAEPISDCLIIHCHGGGFVAQSSQSHETYLRHWAIVLNLPILSIDYSLAPEYPFPRQIQEVLFVYAWILRNPSIAGTTAKRIIFAGDSAGANLVLSLTLWLSELNLRLPDGLFLAYVPVLIQFIPSPSRLLCLMDPLLPLGFLSGCLNAYAGHPDRLSPQSTDLCSEFDVLDKESTPKTSTSIKTFEKKPYLLSPFLAPDSILKKLPPISLLSLELDPLLDDSVEFAKRCRRLGCDVQLDILPGLPHGFLNFAMLSKEAKEGSKLCVQRIRGLFEKASFSELVSW